jgi:hypothetical protein
MLTNFFVKKNDSFTVTLPIDISDEDSPQIVIVDGGIEAYAKRLKQIPEDKIEYHWAKFKRPNWGLDCAIREQSYDGSGMRDRTFSPEKFTELRLKFLLLGSSFFPETDPVSFTKEAIPGGGMYDVLSLQSQELIKQLDPFILGVYLAIAGRIWDLGVNAKTLLTKEEYQILRNDPDGLKKVSQMKGLLTKSREEEEKKKASMSESAKQPSTEMTPTS